MEDDRQSKEGDIQAIESGKKKKSSKKILFFVFFAAVIGIGGYLLWQFVQKPAIGIVTVKAPKQEEAFDRGKERKTYEGKHLSFVYPATFDEKVHETTRKGPVIERIFLSAADIEGKKIAIMVEKRDVVALDEMPSYKMRDMDPKKYARETFSENGLKGTVFANHESVYERTAFFIHRGLLFSVSVSSPIQSESLSADLEAVLRSLRWKE